MAEAEEAEEEFTRALVIRLTGALVCGIVVGMGVKGNHGEGNGMHTWHQNTFGLLYGKTTKTACGKRVSTVNIVKPTETSCTECLSALYDEAYEDHAMWVAATEIAVSHGYSSIREWSTAH